MKILRFQAENVKRLKVVEILPNGAVIELSGDNGNGKTSVLDCIEWALAGAKPIQRTPIRKGADQGFISLDLGDDENGVKFLVTRTFTKSGEDGSEFSTKLKVTSPDGLKGGQDILDALVGRLTFDPMAFLKAKPADRLATLKTLVPNVAFDKIAARRKEAFDERTLVNRDIARHKANLKAVAGQDFSDVPAEPIDVAEVAKAIDLERQATYQRNDNFREWERTRAASRDRVESWLLALTEEQAKLDAARLALKNAEETVAATRKTYESAVAADAEIQAAEAPPSIDPAPMAKLQEQLEQAAAINERVAARKAAEAAAETLKAAETQAEDLTKAIAAADAEVVAAIENAKLPVRGLSIGENDVLLNGLDFEQASDAEQLRTSTAIAMAMNPKLRIIRIRDGGLLDKNAFAILKEVAAEDDYQVWIESVFPHDDAALIMEDGQIAE